MFVYFSHHFVTVPPLGWVRAAHKHGNTMLGQFGLKASVTLCKEIEKFC